MAGGLTISNIPSKRPSLANVILCAANPEETPLTSRIRKGRKLTQMDHKYFVEIKPARKSGGATDGQDVATYEGGGPRKEIVIRAQEFRRTYKVGQQSQEVVDDAAVPDQMAKLRLDYGKEIMKDVEARAVGNAASAADEGTDDKGSRMGGVGYLLSASADSMADNPIPTEVRIPANQRYTGTFANLDENAVQDLLQNRRTLTGNSMELLALVGTDLQRRFDRFENYIPDLTSHTVTFRNMSNHSGERKVRRGIRFYESSFGSVELVIDDFLPSSKRGEILDMEQCEWLPHGSGAKKTPLPNLGGGPRELLAFIGAFSVGDPRGHVLIKPSDE